MGRGLDGAAGEEPRWGVATMGNGVEPQWGVASMGQLGRSHEGHRGAKAMGVLLRQHNCDAHNRMKSGALFSPVVDNGILSCKQPAIQRAEGARRLRAQDAEGTMRGAAAFKRSLDKKEEFISV